MWRCRSRGETVEQGNGMREVCSHVVNSDNTGRYGSEECIESFPSGKGRLHSRPIFHELSLRKMN
jgi:hypothetical protein